LKFGGVSADCIKQVRYGTHDEAVGSFDLQMLMMLMMLMLV
jgi:hypothetical protein